jgi:glycine/sarcosine N-methyltransferase
VVGNDISPAAVERAKREANERQVAVDFVMCDIRDVARVLSSQFDVALAWDNSLPHLLTDQDLVMALRSVRQCLFADGVFLASIRDYDELSRQRPTGVVPVTYSSGGPTRIIGQAWGGERSETVLIRLFVLKQQEGRWSCSVRTTRYRALRRKEMNAAFMAAGFDEVEWLAPDETGYHQPVVTARAA